MMILGWKCLMISRLFLTFPHDEDLDEYEPSLPGVENEVEAEDGVGLAEPPSESELDFMHVDPEPLEALPEGGA